jgi:hypothetical protein
LIPNPCSTRLFDPWQLGPLALSNRIVIAPMCQYSAVDGVVGDWHRMHLGQLAIRAPALLIVEATAVEREGRITNGCVALHDDAQEAALAQVVGMMRMQSPDQAGDPARPCRPQGLEPGALGRRPAAAARPARRLAGDGAVGAGACPG